MAQVTVLVNGRNYTLACEDGEEEHLTALAAFIDSRVAELGRSVGQVGDARLMLMASLVVADEMAVAHERIEELEQDIERLKQAQPEPRQEPVDETVLDEVVVEVVQPRVNEDAVAELLESAAARIETIAARLM